MPFSRQTPASLGERRGAAEHSLQEGRGAVGRVPLPTLLANLFLPRHMGTLGTGLPDFPPGQLRA